MGCQMDKRQSNSDHEMEKKICKYSLFKNERSLEEYGPKRGENSRRIWSQERREVYNGPMG